MTVFDAIIEAKLLLDSKPVKAGKDPRWQAILGINKFIETDPEPIWEFICEMRQTSDEDLRAALSCCLLEDLIENHPEYKLRAQDLALRDSHFCKLLELCRIK